MIFRFLAIIGFLLILTLQVQAQFSNYRMKWVKVHDTRQLDSLSVYPGSIKILSAPATEVSYTYDAASNSLQWQKVPTTDSVLISFRVFPFRVGKPIFHRNPAAYDTNAFYKQEGAISNLGKQTPESREEIFSTKSINKTGSITRGISLGNTQNVFVNSALNLQLEGQLTDNISIVAAISDQNVPFQPEGNTQQLQEFDRVYVQLASKNAKLAAGDLVMQNPLWLQKQTKPSQFLRYYKNVQGAQAEVSYKAAPNSTARTSAGIAISKGKFASILLEVSEGVQGPYRLRGPANERFIIILANSEKVYVDGQLMKRGFNYDYVIDYNLAEIVFNTNILITKFTRVRVDFEYSDRIYSRTILNGSHSQTIGKFGVFANFYSERDNPNTPLTITLNDADKQLLSEIGDSLQKAVVSGISTVDEYNSNQILYEKVDSIVENVVYTMYKQSTNPERASYQLQFSDVGQGNGNYEVLQGNTANGKVYVWKGPLNGVPQGRYEPVKQIPTPNKKQMLTLGSEYNISKNQSIYAEVAFSERDVNLFSPLDSRDNKGNAFKFGYQNRGKVLSFLPNYEWLGNIDYEFDNKYFTPIDRFRDIEYDRDWSAQADTSRADDHIFNITAGIRRATTATQDSSYKATSPNYDTSGDKLIYRFSRRNRGGIINGWQQRIEASKRIGNLQLSSDVFLLRSSRSTDVSEWQRLQVNAAYLTKFLSPGYVYSMDKNSISSLARKDSVIGTAMNFETHQFYLKTQDTSRTRFRIDYTIRQDNLPVEGRLVKNTVSHTASTSLQTKIRQNNDINFLFTYRNLQNLRNPEDSRQEETVMGRIDWNGNWLQEHVRSELTYTAGTGRELQREYVFLLVPTGEGTHTWRDDNGDGRQDLNEFYEAINPDEKNYAKFFVPTDQYIRAFTNTLNYRLNLLMPRSWRGQGMVKSFLAKFSSVSSWTINKKITDDKLINRFIPFATDVPAEALLSAQEALRSTLFFNRASSKYGFDLALFRTLNKQLLTNGFESANTEELKLNSRMNVYKDVSVRLMLGRGIRNNASDYLENRNYRIRSQQAGPEVAWQPNAGFRLTATYLYNIKHNIFTTESNEQAISNQAGLEARWAKVSKRNLSVQARYIQIAYNGEVNNPLGYEMLEALRPGNNFTWSMNLQQRLTNGLQININYEGRNSEAQRTVHIGRMQVTALF
ncbi:hypothetical protein GXP67_18175 [Rhodocytophaga rosea]|uniref:Cell surface protein SprA n=1 Tax=Rhodocytophaga rosea TaxID=2704465 RepID=A0A6C0GK30_9BACT|nr:hypothetical protein [Rhodocytophaga rosea]QHT68431.1 hypothetical protein GXP67_18175 [Rhodocytophaga rosea]